MKTFFSYFGKLFTLSFGALLLWSCLLYVVISLISPSVWIPGGRIIIMEGAVIFALKVMLAAGGGLSAVLSAVFAKRLSK